MNRVEGWVGRKETVGIRFNTGGGGLSRQKVGGKGDFGGILRKVRFSNDPESVHPELVEGWAAIPYPFILNLLKDEPTVDKENRRETKRLVNDRGVHPSTLFRMNGGGGSWLGRGGQGRLVGGLLSRQGRRYTAGRPGKTQQKNREGGQ